MEEEFAIIKKLFEDGLTFRVAGDGKALETEACGVKFLVTPECAFYRVTYLVRAADGGAERRTAGLAGVPVEIGILLHDMCRAA